MSKALTTRTVESVRATDERREIPDGLLRGLYLIIQPKPSGSKSWAVRYRHNGTQIVRSIGRHGSPWTPDTARNEARRLLGIVASGFDPHAQLLAGEGFTTAVDRYLGRKRASLRPKSFSAAEHYAQITRWRATR